MSIAFLRLDDGLRHALGQRVGDFLVGSDVTDLMLNADGHLWIDRLGSGRSDTGVCMTRNDAEFAMRMLATHAGDVLTRETPLLSATLPNTGERIAGTIQPVTDAPTFAIRIPPKQTFDESDFAFSTHREGHNAQYSPREASIVISGHAGADWRGLSKREAIDRAVSERRNILIAGATGSGKTSLLSSFLKRDSICRDRALLLEDTREVQLAAPDHVRMLTSRSVEMQQLVEHAMRYRPDRLFLGEVRSGKVAISLINALNSGHPGSACTVHANSALLALRKMEVLCRQGCGDPQSEAISEAFGLVIFCRRLPGECPTLTEVISVHGHENGVFLTVDHR